MCIRDSCPDDGRGDHRANTSINDGFAIIAVGAIARVPVAVVGTAWLCMCSERLAHVRWG
eukprot:245869-Alexandrium_andersonii.AAC.1